MLMYGLEFAIEDSTVKHGRRRGGGAKWAFSTPLEIGTKKQKFIENLRSAD